MTFMTRYPWATLQDVVAETQYGASHRASEDKGAFPILRMNNITYDGDFVLDDLKRIDLKEGDVSKYTVRRGDLLFNRTNSPELVGKTAVWDRDEAFAFAGYLVRVRFDECKVSSRYVSAFLNSIYGKRMLFAAAKPSINMSNISASALLRLRIPLPPLADQVRISTTLDQAAVIRRKRRQASQNIADLSTSIFREMFGTVVTNAAQWPIEQFDSVCDSRLGKMLDSKQQTGEHRRPYLRNCNVQWDSFDLQDMLEMDFNEGDREEFALRPGDLLICEGGEIGRSAIWRGELSECYFQKALHRVRVHQDKAVPEYILHFMWEMARAQGFREVTSQATIAHLTGVKLKRLPVPLPPIDLQRAFARRIAEVRELQQKLRRADQEAVKLFVALVQRAFRGDL